LTDPTDSLIRRLNVRYYGEAVLLNREGKELGRTKSIEEAKYEREVVHLLAWKGGERS
jgi:hypothetical protein